MNLTVSNVPVLLEILADEREVWHEFIVTGNMEDGVQDLLLTIS